MTPQPLESPRLPSLSPTAPFLVQNWEALTISFPYYFTSIIAKFLNASTIDGYNPYVVNKAEGFAWECPEPDHPHANIGYWGDHQIIYLLKLLEWCQCFNPGRLEEDLEKDRFSYANVPYEIRPYDKIVEDAKDTVWRQHADPWMHASGQCKTHKAPNDSAPQSGGWVGWGHWL